MTATVKKDYKEIAKTNMFIAHAAEIRDICLKEDVDIGVGLDMYISNHGIQTEEIMKQYQEFRKYCREEHSEKYRGGTGKIVEMFSQILWAALPSRPHRCLCPSLLILSIVFDVSKIPINPWNRMRKLLKNFYCDR